MSRAGWHAPIPLAANMSALFGDTYEAGRSVCLVVRTLWLDDGRCESWRTEAGSTG